MPQQAWMEQSHVDISALAQRVTGLEAGVSDIRGAISELSKKLDSKPTNWWGLIAGVVALLSLIGTCFLQAMAPVSATLDRHEHEISHISETAVNRADYLREDEKAERWVTSLRDRVRFNEDRGVFKDDLDRVEKTLNKLVDSSATKSELVDSAHRTDERINAMANSLGELRHEFNASRPIPGGSPQMK